MGFFHSLRRVAKAENAGPLFQKGCRAAKVRLNLLRHKTSHIRSVMSAVAGRIGIAENPTIALQETTSRAVSMVRENVKVMSKQVDEVLREECNALEDRQEDVCIQQKEFTEVSKQTKSRLVDLQTDLQKVAASLQEIAASREIHQYQHGTARRMWSGLEVMCSAPTQGTQRQRLLYESEG